MRKRLHLSRHGYGDVLPRPLSDIEVARLWRTVSAPAAPVIRRRAARPPILLAVGAAALAAVVAFVVVLLLSPAADPLAAPQATIETRAEGDRAIELPDGSRVSMGADTGLRFLSYVAEDIELLLVRGAAEFNVAALPGDVRRFVVAAGGYDVLGKGARFRVAVTGEFPERRVEVTVYDGRVVVNGQQAHETTIALGPGQTWSSEPAFAPIAPAGAPFEPTYPSD